MRTIEYKISYENMISRIPGLFAYLDSDELGDVSLHHAYDSNCGCYGKIVENIKLPDVVFINKSDTDDVKTQAQYNNLPDDQKESYEEKVLNLNLTIDGKTILESGKTYSFRTIITYYYEYKDMFTKYVNKEDSTKQITVDEYKTLDSKRQKLYQRKIESEFIKFVEKGIGKIEIPDEEYDKLLKNSGIYINICNNNYTILKDEYDKLSEDKQKLYKLKINQNVPEFLYLANVVGLYDELVKMGKQCGFYQKNKENFGNDKHMCCLCERYTDMGGDDLKDYVGGLIVRYKKISDEYFGYADTEKSMTLDFDVDLLSSYDDNGIMNCYIEEWLPYKRYYKGDRVFYDGDIWVCTVENTGDWDEDELRVVFSKNYFKKAERVFEKVVSTYQNIDNESDKLTEDQYYEELESKETIEEKDEFKAKYKLVKSELETNPSEIKLMGRTDTKLNDLARFVTYMNDNNVGEKPKNGRDWLFYYRIGTVCNITTLNDDMGNILNLNGVTANDGDESNLEAYGDSIINIIGDENEKAITFEYVVNAHLIGGSHSQKTDEDGKIIHYWSDFEVESKTGVKYRETYTYETDSDLDKLIKGDFRLIIGYKSDGTPECDETEFTFNDYINGKYDNNLKSFKFEFITSNNELNFTKTIANQDVDIVSSSTDFELLKASNNEFMEVASMNDAEFYVDEENKYRQRGIHMFRHDYFNGITYAPSKNIDVNIERGSTSCFQQHISFGEIKTLNDMVEYHNGSFFKLNEE